MPKKILQDLVGLWLLLTCCLLGGLMLNELRTQPLALVYSSPQSRIAQSVKNLGAPPDHSPIADGDVAIDEMQKLSTSHAALILDARPEVFYRLGHIPSALSLPRDDFEKQYQSLQAMLQSHHDSPLVVYCSGTDCHDSQMIADGLQKLGYPHVRIFRGGWSDWESANLPEEKE